MIGWFINVSVLRQPTHPHSHEADSRMVEVAKARIAIKNCARNSSDRPERIRANVLATMPDDAKTVSDIPWLLEHLVSR